MNIEDEYSPKINYEQGAVKKIKRKKHNHNKKWKKERHAKRRGDKELRRKRKRGGRLKAWHATKPLKPKQPNVFEKIEAPKNFSLINNTENVLLYFKEISRLFSERKQVECNLENIENMTQDAIALLIAKVKDVSFTRGLNIRGNSPIKKDLKTLWDKSGFLEHVSTNLIPTENNNNLLIHKVTNNKVENEIAKRVGEIAVKYTFNTNEKFKPLYEILIECMANTNNHAGLDKEGIYNWWILVYNDDKTKGSVRVWAL